MWQHNYEPVAGSLALSAIVAAIPIAVLFTMLGVLRKPAWISAMTGARLGLRRRVRGVRNAGEPGADLDDLRRRLRPLSDRVDRLHFDHALPPGGGHRQVRDHQGLGRQPHRRSPAAGDVHRLFIRRVHRGRSGVWRAGRGLGRDACRTRLQPVLRRRHLPAREYRAGRIRIDRHSRHDAGERHRACRCWRSAR